MKTLIQILVICAGFFSAKAQTLTYFWTNGVPLAATNFNIGTKTFYLTTNGVKGVNWALKQWNSSMGLTGTNRIDWRDSIGYGWFLAAEQWSASAETEANSKASIQRIKTALPDLPESTLSNVYWTIFNTPMP